MRTIIFFFLCCVSSTSLHSQALTEYNDPIKHPHHVNKTTVAKLNGKPINYYLNHPGVSETAKLYYKGQFAPYDDDATFAMVDSILTNNKNTRPFYFFLFNQLMKTADGALAEFYATACASYLKKFPCELFDLAADPVYEVDDEKWVDLASFDLNGREVAKKYLEEIDQVINRNCTSHKAAWKTTSAAIKKAVDENFPDTEHKIKK